MSEVIERPQAEEKEKHAVILDPTRFGLREQERQDWVVNAAAGTTVEQVLESAYWAHVAARMVPYARIEVLEESGAWMLELLVVAKDRTWAKVKLLQRYDLEAAQAMPAALEKHTVEWKGPQRKWSVIRKVDSQIVQDGFSSRSEAEAWRAHHERVIA